jgi:hypothetical protein
METHLHSASLALEKIAVDHAEFFEDSPPQPGGTPPKSL